MTNYSKEITGSVTSVHISNNGDISKELTETIQVEFDGIVADKHRSYSKVIIPSNITNPRSMMNFFISYFLLLLFQ